jgi:hypothetical protein
MHGVLFADFVQIDGVDSVVETAIRELKNNKRKSRTPTKTTTLIITGVQRVRLITNNILLHQQKQKHTS